MCVVDHELGNFSITPIHLSEMEHLEASRGSATPRDGLVINEDADKVNVALASLPLSKEAEDALITEIKSMFETHDFTPKEEEELRKILNCKYGEVNIFHC